MKKILCITLLSLFTFIHANDEKLLPELEEFITVKPLEDKDLEGNLFVGLMGMFLPQKNYIEVSKNYFKKNWEVNLLHPNRDELDESDYYSIDTFIPKGDEKLQVDLGDYDKREIFPCLTYLNKECVFKTVQHRKALKQIVKNNQRLLNRLRDIVTRSSYSTAIPNAGAIFSELPKFVDISSLENIIAHDAILDISEGNIDKGLSALVLLKQMANIYHNKSSRFSLVDGVYNTVVREQELDQVLDGLLSSGMLDNILDDPKLAYLFSLKSINEIDFVFQKSNVHELLWYMQFDLYSFIEQVEDEFLGMIKPEEVSVFTKSTYSFITELVAINNKGELLTYKTIKDTASHYSPFDAVLIDIANLYGVIDGNIRNKYLEQQNYHRLVYLKYRIMKDKIAYADIPKFLESMGELAKNTVTKEPYQFDAETGILSTPLFNKKSFSKNLRERLEQDESIKHFQVMIINEGTNKNSEVQNVFDEKSHEVTNTKDQKILDDVQKMLQKAKKEINQEQYEAGILTLDGALQILGDRYFTTGLEDDSDLKILAAKEQIKNGKLNMGVPILYRILESRIQLFKDKINSK